MQHTLQHTCQPFNAHCNTYCNTHWYRLINSSTVSAMQHALQHTLLQHPLQHTLLPTDHRAPIARQCQPRNAHCNTYSCNTLQHTLVPPHHMLNRVSQCNIHWNTHYCNTHCNTHCNTLVPTDPQALMARLCQPYLCYPSAEIAQMPWYCSASASVAHQNRWDIVPSPTFLLFFGCAFLFSDERCNDAVNKIAHTCTRTQTDKNKKIKTPNAVVGLLLNNQKGHPTVWVMPKFKGLPRRFANDSTTLNNKTSTASNCAEDQIFKHLILCTRF